MIHFLWLGTMKVCLGGTFDQLHDGHKRLIMTACILAGHSGTVVIGITKGSLASKQGPIASYQQRKKAIETFLLQEKTIPHVVLTPIQDKYGPSVDEEFDAIVVSPETKPIAEEINEKRRQRGKKPLQIIMVPYVLAKDGRAISSTRIRNGEIDDHGTLLKESVNLRK
jgi:pantetheine-phosphate adenylyltransferase